MAGLQRKPCPTINGRCFWCEGDLTVASPRRGVVMLADVKENHQPWCPWREVIDYAMLEDEWAVREAKHDADPPGPPDPG